MKIPSSEKGEGIFIGFISGFQILFRNFITILRDSI